MRARALVVGLLAMLAMCVMSLDVAAQGVRTPDNEDILARTINVDSPYYLDNLMAKYLAWQQPLTYEEMHYLY